MAKGLIAVRTSTAGMRRVRNFRRYDRETGTTTIEERDIFLFPRMDDNRFLTEPVGVVVDKDGNETGEIIIIQELDDLPNTESE